MLVAAPPTAPRPCLQPRPACCPAAVLHGRQLATPRGAAATLCCNKCAWRGCWACRGHACRSTKHDVAAVRRGCVVPQCRVSCSGLRACRGRASRRRSAAARRTRPRPPTAAPSTAGCRPRRRAWTRSTRAAWRSPRPRSRPSPSASRPCARCAGAPRAPRVGLASGPVHHGALDERAHALQRQSVRAARSAGAAVSTGRRRG